MLSIITSTSFALLAVLASAAPAPAQNIAPRQGFIASIFFEGATPDANFSMAVPTDNSNFAITNPLSVSYISSPGGAFCTFTGSDGGENVLFGEETIVVAPPQPQVSGNCQTA